MTEDNGRKLTDKEFRDAQRRLLESCDKALDALEASDNPRPSHQVNIRSMNKQRERILAGKIGLD